MDSFDVIVLGTGASGLTAAMTAAGHGASVGLFEKGEEVGGTSARSGGMIWIPCNHQTEEFGLSDSREEALTYLYSLSHGMIIDELAEAFVDGGPQMLRWLEDNMPVTFGVVEGFPDYHPQHPGGKTGGRRSLECPLFPYGELGEWSDRVVQGYQMGKHLVMNETTLGKGTTDHIEPAEAQRRLEGDLRGCGQALIGRLLKGCSIARSFRIRAIAPFACWSRTVELSVSASRSATRPATSKLAAAWCWRPADSTEIRNWCAASSVVHCNAASLWRQTPATG